MVKQKYLLMNRGIKVASVTSNKDVEYALQQDAKNLFNWKLKGVFVDWNSNKVMASYQRTLPSLDWSLEVMQLKPHVLVKN